MRYDGGGHTLNRVPDSPDVGARVRARRESLGMTRDDLAASYRLATGERTTPNTLARWEARGNVNAAQVAVLADLLGVSPAWILLGEKP